MSYAIPFNRACLAGNEFAYMKQAITNDHISGDGPFTRQAAALLERAIGVPKALLTTSCTHALELSAILLDIGPGDEVITPSFTFTSTINAFILRGAWPIFADIRPDTLNLDETKLEALITPRTKAILPVHYAGVGCEMDAIMAIARRHNVPVVEDNAHALFATYRGKQLGTFGVMATQSFHETKNFTCGEGGALLINDVSFVERAEIIREKGTDRSRFFRGQVDKYGWVDVGSSYLSSDILAAFLTAQLEEREAIQAKRQRIWQTYNTELSGWAAEHNVRLPIVPAYCEQPAHMFYLLLPSLAVRSALIAHLKARGILAVFHYLPLHSSEMGRRFDGHTGQCPVTETVSDTLLRLPLFNDLTEAEQASVITALKEFDKWTIDD